MEPRDKVHVGAGWYGHQGPDGAPLTASRGCCSAPRAPDPPRRTAPEACQLLHLARSAPECTHTVGIELQPAGRSPIREQRPTSHSARGCASPTGMETFGDISAWLTPAIIIGLFLWLRADIRAQEGRFADIGP